MLTAFRDLVCWETEADKLTSLQWPIHLINSIDNSKCYTAGTAKAFSELSKYQNVIYISLWLFSFFFFFLLF